VSDDQAFKDALGLDTAAFQQEWLGSVGAQAPVRHGPLPAPVGPLPQGWSGAAPNPSVQPGATGVPGAAASPDVNPAIGRPPGATSGGLSVGIVAAVVLVGVGAVLIGVLLVQRSRRPNGAIPLAVGSEPTGADLPPMDPPGSVPWSLPGEASADVLPPDGPWPPPPPSAPAPAESPETRPPDQPQP